MKQAKPAPPAQDEIWTADRPRRRDTVVIEDDGPYNRWPRWAWKPEKSEEIQSFMRQCAALQEVDPKADKRWHAESEHFAPWREARELENQWWDGDWRLRETMAARRPARRQDSWLRAGMKLDEARRGQYWLCRTRAELARAELRVTDLDAGDPAAARNWFEQCQWFEKFLAECWSAECERVELDQGDSRRQPDSADLRRWRAERQFERMMELRWSHQRELSKNKA